MARVIDVGMPGLGPWRPVIELSETFDAPDPTDPLLTVQLALCDYLESEPDSPEQAAALDALAVETRDDPAARARLVELAEGIGAWHLPRLVDQHQPTRRVVELSRPVELNHQPTPAPAPTRPAHRPIPMETSVINHDDSTFVGDQRYRPISADPAPATDTTGGYRPIMETEQEARERAEFLRRVRQERNDGKAILDRGAPDGGRDPERWDETTGKLVRKAEIRPEDLKPRPKQWVHEDGSPIVDRTGTALGDPTSINRETLYRNDVMLTSAKSFVQMVRDQGFTSLYAHEDEWRRKWERQDRDERLRRIGYLPPAS